MPSKEHLALVEKVAAVLNEQEGCYFQPQDYHRGAAKEVLSTIRAALQELNANQEQIGFREAFDSFQMLDGEPFLQIDVAQRVFSAVLAASALGEQSE